MTKITHYCDHCGKELDRMTDYLCCEVDIYERIEMDICASCLEKLTNMVKDFCSYGERRIKHG